MALRAFAFAGTRLELPLVRIGCVAIRALGESDGAFEISPGMAIAATHLQVHSGQRKFRFRMVELDGQVVHLLPPAGRMAGFARGLEGSLVRIRMAGRAGIELESGELYSLVRPGWQVAFSAGNLRVHASQRIFCLRMIELLGLFPVRKIVAARAIVAKLAFVRIGVAGNAICRKSQIRSGEVLFLNQRPLGRCDVHWRMAFLARDAAMLFNQRIAGKPMVELPERWLPVHQRKVGSIVFEVAAHAIIAIRILHSNLRVETAMIGQSLCDLFVAVEALERRRACTELMAGGALRRAVQGLMSFRKRTGRNLRVRHGCSNQNEHRNSGEKSRKTNLSDEPAGLAF